MRLLAIAAVAFVLCGCARFAPVRVYAQFEGADHAPLDDVLSAMSGLGVPFERADSQGPADVMFARGGDGTQPCLDGASHPPFILLQPSCMLGNDPYTQARTQAAMAHALGHHIGMNDLQMTAAVMAGDGLVRTGGSFTCSHPLIENDFHPTAADTAEFERTHP